MNQAEARVTVRPHSKTTAALFSVAVNLVLIGGKLVVGLLTGSVALLADALHFSSDLWASVAVLVGLTLIGLFGWRVADPLAGVAVAVIIGTTAIEQGRRTTQVLLDAMPDRKTLAAIEQILQT